MSLFELYDEGVEVLGDGIDSFMPWLGVVGKVAGGALGGVTGGGSTEKKSEDRRPSAPAAPAVDVAAQVKQALEDERRRQQQDKLDADVRGMRTVMIVVGLGAAGIATWALLKK